MENLTALRGVRTWLLAAALGAACGGGDPPGGGNNNGTTDGGDETDGTTGNGGTDGHVPDPDNPLIQAMPGTWTVERFEWTENGEPREEVPDPPLTGALTVHPDFPQCQPPGEHTVNLCDGHGFTAGAPGDACICLHRLREPVGTISVQPPILILERDTVRAGNHAAFPAGDWNGNVLENGLRMRVVFHMSGQDFTIHYRKLD